MFSLLWAKLTDVGKTLVQLDGLFVDSHTINSRLYFRNRFFAAAVRKGGNIKSPPGWSSI
ncbi:hypothetical protein K040078D81_44000 [Blautia hominis]|uniref:Uncharacterized protein n=1 Tax=Blautia hominis TaxID=2025493 RepID=A0ABQ0BFP7_9FIRM